MNDETAVDGIHRRFRTLREAPPHIVAAAGAQAPPGLSPQPS